MPERRTATLLRLWVILQHREWINFCQMGLPFRPEIENYLGSILSMLVSGYVILKQDPFYLLCFTVVDVQGGDDNISDVADGNSDDDEV